MENEWSTFHRWWVYQQERFPIVAHGALIAGFSLSTVGYTASLLGTRRLSAAGVGVSLVVSFLFFLQIRIADEFKDFEDDVRYRPDRPVPRGLVSLRELGMLAVFAAAVQMCLALWLEPKLAFVLVVAWSYLLLMTVEFFVPDWLTARPVAYMISHLVILPLLAAFVSASVWLSHRNMPPRLGWYLIFSYGSGAVLELGRKVRAPVDELTGVRTYSALWGSRRAVSVWLSAMLLTALCATRAAWQIDFWLPMAVLLVMLMLGAALVARRFSAAPSTISAKRLESFSAAWVLATYVGLGIVPMCWSWCATLAGSPP